MVRAWDCAGTEGAGDYTAGVGMARKDGIYYIWNVRRGQWSAARRNRAIEWVGHNDHAQHKRVYYTIEQEPGAAGKGQYKETAKHLSRYPVSASPKTIDSATFMEPLQSQFEMGNVRIIRGDWNQDFVGELLAFPTGKYDDQVIAAGHAYHKLQEVGPLMMGTF